jgi:hypothetical protein
MNPLVERYVRHAKRFGDANTVYETAARDGLSAAELGYLAARLAKLDPKRAANEYWASRRREGWPRFRLTDRQKVRLVRRLLRAGVPVKQICTYAHTTPAWVDGVHSDLEAEAEFAKLIGPCVGKPEDPWDEWEYPVLSLGPDQYPYANDTGVGPVDLLDGNLDPSLYRRFSALMGHGSDSAESTPDRLSTSGIGGDIVAAGLRFERLTVLRIERDASNRKVAVCRCDCGTETTAKPSHLLRGEKRSCGCLRRARMAAMKQREGASA